MLQSFPAIYENGVLKPLIPLSLAEHEHVWVQVSPQSARLEKASDVIEMQRRAAEELDAAMAALPDNSPAKDESFYDVASRLGIIGSVHGTPPDLSTNKKYLQGLGKRDS